MGGPLGTIEVYRDKGDYGGPLFVWECIRSILRNSREPNKGFRV